MNLEYIKKQESRIIELIYKYFSVLEEYRNGKGKKVDLQHLYQEISDFYVEEKNKFIKKKYGGTVTDNVDRCIICLGNSEEGPLYSHEHIAYRGTDGNPINKNTACFFHVNCLKGMIQLKLGVDESDIDNYFIECPVCISVLISSELENYDNEKKRFVAIKKPNNYHNNDISQGFNLIDFRNIPAGWNIGEDRLFDRLISIFETAIIMLVWLIFFITIYEYSVNQDNRINRIEHDLHNLQELNARLYEVSRYAMDNENGNEAIRILNSLVANFYDNINYENGITLNDNMDNNERFIEAFSNALNRAFPDNELGGKKKRRKNSMKKKTKKKRSKKNKTKKKGGDGTYVRDEEYVVPGELWHKGLTESPRARRMREMAIIELARIKNQYNVLDEQWKKKKYIIYNAKRSCSYFKNYFIDHINYAIRYLNTIERFHPSIINHYNIIQEENFYEAKLRLLEKHVCDDNGCLPGKTCVVSGGKEKKTKKKKN